ncbi:hypothetical protein IAT38_007844 [Cryptococcus sp. DSM 104549]
MLVWARVQKAKRGQHWHTVRDDLAEMSAVMVELDEMMQLLGTRSRALSSAPLAVLRLTRRVEADGPRESVVMAALERLNEIVTAIRDICHNEKSESLNIDFCDGDDGEPEGTPSLLASLCDSSESSKDTSNPSPHTPDSPVVNNVVPDDDADLTLEELDEIFQIAMLMEEEEDEIEGMTEEGRVVENHPGMALRR